MRSPLRDLSNLLCCDHSASKNTKSEINCDPMHAAGLFGVPCPIASFELKNDSESLAGVNFAQGGGGVTYAFGYTPLDTQVNQLESLVRKKVLPKSHLRRSVALVSLGVNDYGAYNAFHSPKVHSGRIMGFRCTTRGCLRLFFLKYSNLEPVGGAKYLPV